MNTTTGDPGLAATLQSRSREIARTAVERLGSSQRTLAATILAVRFVDRCASHAAADDWAELPLWVEQSCDRYVDILPAPRVIAAAVDGVTRVVESALPQTRGAFAAVRPAVDAAVGRQRVTRLTRVRETIDEVDVVIDGLLTRLNQSDVLTAEHSRAVSSWCIRLGHRLGWSKDEVTHLGRAGLVHDIGKVTTPAEILQAPRRLGESEMTVMRMHAAAGGDIVIGIPLIANLLPAVRSHHERMDGTGYPDRLSGEAIPRIARIVAVADAFNAMIGRRPYRPPLAPSVALERLIEGRGTQFDPDIVDAMVDVVQPNPRDSV